LLPPVAGASVGLDWSIFSLVDGSAGFQSDPGATAQENAEWRPQTLHARHAAPQSVKRIRQPTAQPSYLQHFFRIWRHRDRGGYHGLTGRHDSVCESIGGHDVELGAVEPDGLDRPNTPASFSFPTLKEIQ